MKLRVVVCEDEEDDYELTLRELRRGGLEVEATRVWTEADLEAALARPCDIVLTDHQIPGYGGPQAIATVKRVAPDVPVIVISGTIGEEAATAVLHAGASDFIVKGRLTRLVPAIHRALDAASDRRARRAAEDELRRSNARLARQRDELARSNAELQDFAYAAAHDLQEPLRMVANHLQVVERRLAGTLDAVTARSLGHAVAGAQRMLRMVRDVLQYAQIGSDDGRARVALGDALADARAALAETLASAGAQIRVDGELPTVVGSRSQLARLFQNLLANAAKYRSERPPRIVVDAREAGGRWEVRVRDNGVGIPPESREEVFRLFRRLDGGDPEGAGMGLAIARKIVERHGGAIRIDDGDDGGAAIVVTLPRAEASDEEPSLARQASKI